MKKINSFGSFKDYCYACYNTPIATWIIDKPNPIIVGLTLNNLQVIFYINYYFFFYFTLLNISSFKIKLNIITIIKIFNNFKSQLIF